MDYEQRRQAARDRCAAALARSMSVNASDAALLNLRYELRRIDREEERANERDDDPPEPSPEYDPAYADRAAANWLADRTSGP